MSRWPWGTKYKKMSLLIMFHKPQSSWRVLLYNYIMIIVTCQYDMFCLWVVYCITQFTVCFITIYLVLIANYINKLVFAVNDMNGVPCRNTSLNYCTCKYIFYQHKRIEMLQVYQLVPQRNQVTRYYWMLVMTET